MGKNLKEFFLKIPQFPQNIYIPTELFFKVRPITKGQSVRYMT